VADEEPTVLGNLPRSRPGRRSEKRSSPAAAKPRARRPKAAPPPEPDTQERDGDPVGDAIRAASAVAETGARVANGVARELIRRLPRL
jgi:hypothetical protein